MENSSEILNAAMSTSRKLPDDMRQTYTVATTPGQSNLSLDGLRFNRLVQALSALGPVVTHAELENAFQRAAGASAGAKLTFEEVAAAARQFEKQIQHGGSADSVSRRKRTRRETEQLHAHTAGRPAPRR